MRFIDHLLTEDASTDFMETASCIGIICDNRLASDIKRFIDTGDGDYIQLFGEVQSIAGSSGYDWNKAGVKIIKSIKLTNNNKIMVCLNLVVGMNIFMNDVGYGLVGNNPYFVHNSIKKYYTAEKKTAGVIKYTKDNTSDVVICSSKATDLLSGMSSEDVIDNNERYMTTPSGIKYAQISLKKDEKAAQLGKVTKFIKGTYDIDSNKDISTFLEEGVISSIKSAFTGLFNKINKLFGGMVIRVKKRFGKVNAKYMNDFERAMGVNEKKTPAPDTNTLVSTIKANPEKAIHLINNEIRRFQGMVAGTNVATKVTLIKAKPLVDDTDVYKVVSNYLTIRTAIDMMGDQKDLSSRIHRIVGEMSWGGTKRPMWKVFGYFKTKSYHYMGTLQSFIDNEKPDVDNIDLFGLRVNPNGPYYTMYYILLESVGDKGKTYAQLRTGTNSSSHPSFILEGTARLGPFPIEKSLTDIM